jgi:Fic family protein
LLNETRLTGNWETWLEFFTEAVIESAHQAIDAADRLLKMAAHDRQRISGLKWTSGSVRLIHQAMMERPLVTSQWLQKKTLLTQPTVNKSLIELEKLGIIEETTGRKRNRLYSYTEYIRILDEGTELP